MTEQEKFVRDQIIEIYPQLQINCKKTCGAGYDAWGHDLLAMSIEMYLEKPIEYQLKVIDDGKLENFITFVMGLQLKSSSSRFYHTYRKPFEKSRELLDNYNYTKYIKTQKPFKPTDYIEDEPNEVIDCINAYRDKLDPFEKVVLDRIIIEKENIKDLALEFDIPYYNFVKAKNEIIKKIKKSCQHWL